MTRNEGDGTQRDDEAIARLLDGVTLEEPPRDLKENVLRAIAARPAPAREGWLESLRAGLKRRLLPQLSPFAVGAAVGVIALALLSDRVGLRATGAGPMAGAMVPLSSRAPAAVMDDQQFELNGANVRLWTWQDHDRIVASVDARTSDEVAITLQFDSDRLRIERVGQAAPQGGVEYGPGRVRVRQAASGRVDIVFGSSGAGDAPIQVVIVSGSTVAQGTISTRARLP